MASLFLTILNMSMVASWVILAVILLRLLLRRAPKWMTCALWTIVALRLICPFSIESMFSLIPSAEIVSPAELQFSESPAIDTGIPAINNTLNPIIQDSLAAAPEASVNQVQILIFAGHVIWLVGLTVMLGYAAVSFLRVRRMLAEAVASQENVYLCDAVNSPFIFGLLHPGIYLPSNIDETQLDYVLAHERSHLKRLDHVWKTLGYFLLAVYWFNPLVWIAYFLLCQDIELACDERVIQDLDMDERKAYSKALVAFSMKRRMITFCPIAFGEVSIKERVKTVLNYKKPAFGLVVTTVIVCMIAAAVFLTNPPKNSGNDGMINSQNQQKSPENNGMINSQNQQNNPETDGTINIQYGQNDPKAVRIPDTQNERNDPNITEMINVEKEQLTEQLLTMYQAAFADSYTITDSKLVVTHTEGERANCLFGAKWIMLREPKDQPWVQGMYQAAQNLTDEDQKAYALDIAEGWVKEIELSWPKEEYKEVPVVIMQEAQLLTLYCPYTINGAETLIPLHKYLDEYVKTDEQVYYDGMDVMVEAVKASFPENTANAVDTAG